jgi:hypothetical protein
MRRGTGSMRTFATSAESGILPIPAAADTTRSAFAL